MTKDMTNDIQTTQHDGPQQGEIILYQPDETVRLEVRLEDDTVWLTQQQMAELFQTTRNNVTLHIGNVYKEHELVAESTSKESLLVRMEGKRQVTRQRKLYNLDVIISVGYRVKTQPAVSARRGEYLPAQPRPLPHHRRHGLGDDAPAPGGGSGRLRGRKSVGFLV